MFLPALNQACFSLFSQPMNQALSQPILLVADRATAHKGSLLAEPPVVLARLPTPFPELNPVEGFFEELRQAMKSRSFETLQQDCVEGLLQTYFGVPQRVFN